MREFMIKLYSYENFPIILFSVIGILLVLFIITLILALNDTKKKKDNIINEDKSDDKTLPEVHDEVISSTKPDIKEEVVPENTPIIEDFSFDDVDLPSTTKVVDNSSKEVVSPNIDFTQVVSSEEIELPKTNDIFKEEKQAEPTKVINETDIFNVKSLNDIPEEEYRIR